MNKIVNEKLDEVYYQEELNNGLKVTIFHKPEFKTSVCAFGTPYGSLNINQIKDGKDYHFNPGIAHFLEHKLFEEEEKDMLNVFSSLGAHVNAFTSHKETVYYFSTSLDNVDKTLNLLLDFVQNLNITDKSVEKEKGIIIQELHMYLAQPEARLLNEIYSSVYKNNPLKNDIGGDDNSVKAITKDELELCYKLNYHPSNMEVVIVTPLDPNHLMDLIRDNQNKKSFIKEEIPHDIPFIEPLSVNRDFYRFNMDVKTNKYCYAIKLQPNFKSELDAAICELKTKFYLNSYFTPNNPSYQSWIDNKLINDYFEFVVDFSMNSALILFFNEKENLSDVDLDNFKELINNELKKDLFKEEDFMRTKRKLLGQTYRDFNDVEDLCINYIRNDLEGTNLFSFIEESNKLTYDDVKEYFKTLDLSNFSTIICGRNDKD